MKALVIGGTGTVGSCVVRELLARGAGVTVLTRRPGVALLPSGAEALKGDLLDPATVRTAFRGMDAVFMANALGTSETHEGLMAVMGASQAGVKRFAYLSIHRLHRAPFLPHFASKRPIELALQASGMEFAVLRANNFFQNDLWYKEALLQHHLYPQPLGSLGLSRIDARDIGEAAAVALTSAAGESKVIELPGPRVLTGQECARVWAEALGSHVAYGGDGLDAWEKSAAALMPAWLCYDLRHMYGWFQTNGLVAEPGEIDRLTSLLGHPLRTFEAYVDETARGWMAKAA